ncbi:hypothetical protein Goari_014042 [Gossypium aridum]|uniref:Uncharacterized protein n=1 Tax=Gossypium aridum TaxID=34290 RepID=A0A7J8XI56_GOSAI|nr:hypothetical protein [Gossypium aridum]
MALSIVIKLVGRKIAFNTLLNKKAWKTEIELRNDPFLLSEEPKKWSPGGAQLDPYLDVVDELKSVIEVVFIFGGIFATLAIARLSTAMVAPMIVLTGVAGFN